MNSSLQSLFFFPLTLFFLTLIPFTAIGAEETKTNNCHCFRNRVFNPADKFISDDYILTTTFNSLLASEFKISKRQIIMMKMRDGVANKDLMTALFIAQKTGIETTQLLQMKKTKSWQEIAEALGSNITSQKVLEDISFIQNSKSNENIVEEISHRLMTSRFAPAPNVINQLKEDKLNTKQIVLSFTLARHAGIPVKKISEQFLSRGLSWSEIANNLGLQPADAGKLLEPDTQKEKQQPASQMPSR